MVYVITLPCKDHDLFHIEFYTLLQKVKFLLWYCQLLVNDI